MIRPVYRTHLIDDKALQEALIRAAARRQDKPNRWEREQLEALTTEYGQAARGDGHDQCTVRVTYDDRSGAQIDRDITFCYRCGAIEGSAKARQVCQVAKARWAYLAEADKAPARLRAARYPSPKRKPYDPDLYEYFHGAEVGALWSDGDRDTDEVLDAVPGFRRTWRVLGWLGWAEQNVLRRYYEGDQVDADQVTKAHQEFAELRRLSYPPKVERKVRVRRSVQKPERFYSVSELAKIGGKSRRQMSRLVRGHGTLRPNGRGRSTWMISENKIRGISAEWGYIFDGLEAPKPDIKGRAVVTISMSTESANDTKSTEPLAIRGHDSAPCIRSDDSVAPSAIKSIRFWAKPNYQWQRGPTPAVRVTGRPKVVTFARAA